MPVVEVYATQYFAIYPIYDIVLEYYSVMQIYIFFVQSFYLELVMKDGLTNEMKYRAVY